MFSPPSPLSLFLKSLVVTVSPCVDETRVGPPASDMACNIGFISSYISSLNGPGTGGNGLKNVCRGVWICYPCNLE